MGRGSRNNGIGKTAKQVAIIAVILLFAVPVGVFGYNAYAAPFWGLPAIVMPWAASGTTPGTGTPQGDMVAVDRQVDFTLWDMYGGAGLASKTVIWYDSNGAVVDTLTTSTGGQVDTTATYMSGESYIAFVDDGNAHYFIPFTIPMMSRANAEGTTAQHYVKLYGFAAETYNDLLSVGSSTVADAGDYNVTASGATGTFNYALDAVTDNKAMLPTGYDEPRFADAVAFTSDPVYDISQDNMVFVVVSGTGYASVKLTNMDGSYTVGTTKVYYKTLNNMASNFIQYKVGSDYVYAGNVNIPLIFDCTGIAANATVQIYSFAYANAGYAQDMSATGSTATDYGPRAIQLAETTINVCT